MVVAVGAMAPYIIVLMIIYYGEQKVIRITFYISTIIEVFKCIQC